LSLIIENYKSFFPASLSDVSGNLKPAGSWRVDVHSASDCQPEEAFAHAYAIQATAGTHAKHAQSR
jgi:hypothetical protein